MSSDGKRVVPLAPELRAAALDMAQRASANRAEFGSAAVPRSSFAHLEHFGLLRALRKAGRAIGIEDPYFRLHEGHAGTRTVIDGVECLNFASYDYLGLNADPRPAAAAAVAIGRFGVSASGSRMVSGSRPVHLELEAELARNYGAEAALCFVSGHATNVSTIAALMRKGDLILSDRFVHNSVSLGAQATEAARRSFAHNDLGMLERILARERSDWRNVLVVVEGLYSMDGDLPDLAGLIALRDRYGFWLMVDEAHALGCVGATGRGSFEEQGVDPSKIDIWMGTLSKTLASTGGFVAGSADLVEYLRWFAPGFVFSVALPPMLAASALAALGIMRAEPERAARLRALSLHFAATAGSLGLDTGLARGHGVMPIVVGDSAVASRLSQRLLARGINVAPVTFPGVSANAARLRFFLQAGHETGDIDRALAAVREELDDIGSSGFTEMAARLTAGILGAKVT